MVSRHRFIVAFVVTLILVTTGCGKAKTTKLEQAKQLLHKKDHAQARELCNELLAENPMHYEAMLLRGQVHDSEGTPGEAMADFTKAIEIAPTKPDGYAFRYKLNIELAEHESDPERAEAFDLAALEDHRNYLKFSPSAADVAKLSPQVAKPKSLSQPIPGLEQPFEQPEFDDPLADLDLDQHSDELGEKSDLPGDAVKGEPPADNLPAKSVPGKWLADRAESLKKIEALDLQDSDKLTEPTLPPHLDPTKPELLLPDLSPPQITRFNLPFSDGLSVPVPVRPASRAKTTGILPLPDDEDVATRDERPFRQRSSSPTSPFLNAPNVGRSTGIISGRASQDSSTRENRRAGAGTLTGLWAPWAPQSPRPGEFAKPADGADPAVKPVQILSMALPGTAPSSVSGQPAGVKLVPAPGEAGYLHFKPRPTGLYTPTFNDR